MIETLNNVFLEVRLHVSEPESVGFISVVNILAPWISPIIAFLLGLFSTRLTRLFNRPKLTLKLVSDEGTLTNTGSTSGPTRRFFHLRVENKTRFVGVHDVQICLLDAIVELDEHPPVHGYTGPSPLPWRHNLGGGDGTVPRTLGAEIEADIFNISDYDLMISGSAPFAMPSCIHTPEGKWVKSGKGRAKFMQHMKLRLFAQARGVEADSNIIELEVKWDWRGWKTDCPIPRLSIMAIDHSSMPGLVKKGRDVSPPKYRSDTGRLYWGGQDKPDTE